MFMAKKTGVIAIFLLITTVAFYVCGIYGSYQEKNELEMDTVSYLENKGYSPEADIEKMSIVCVNQKEGIYAAVVIFKNEPLVDYFYSYKPNLKEIEQIAVVNEGTALTLKHKEGEY